MHLDPAAGKLCLRHGGNLIEDGVELELARVDVQLTGFDLGKIKDVVEHIEQGAGAGVQFADVVFLLKIQRGGRQQVDQADDAVQGGADLVAHVGEETRLGLVGLFRQLARGIQFLGAFGDLQLQAAGKLFELVIGAVQLEQHAVEGALEHVQFVVVMLVQADIHLLGFDLAQIE